ncbi:hypothetical protein [Pseudoalteromonas sp. SaAl2]
MKVLDDLWTSIRGNAQTKINDPIVGAFIVSWCLCNWDRISILFWGSGKLEERVYLFSKKMAVFNSPSILWTNFDILLLPLLLTVTYIFVSPKVAHFVDEKLNSINTKRHKYAIEADINKVNKQRELNKARLRANPENEFLAEEVKNDLAIEKSEAEIKLAEAEAAKSRLQEAKAKETAANIELEKRQAQKESEKREYAISAAKQNAMLASHQFPSAYLFLALLSESIKLDGKVMSLEGVAKCIAALFGYESFEYLLKDKKFQNDRLEQLKYVLISSDALSVVLQEIIDEEELEDVDSEWLLGHLELIFEKLPYELILDETLAHRIGEEVNINSHELLQEEGVTAGMAETDTFFDEVDELEINDFVYDQKNKKFFVKLSGTASGEHRREAEVPGQSIDIFVEAYCEALVGSYGLSDYKIHAYATPTDYQ